MRRVFLCFEGTELLPLHAFSSRTLVLRLQPVPRPTLSLLGALAEKRHLSSS